MAVALFVRVRNIAQGVGVHMLMQVQAVAATELLPFNAHEFGTSVP